MRISDWSSDVCSSDLTCRTRAGSASSQRCGRRTRRAAARVSAARPARPIRKGSYRARKEIRLPPLVDIRIYTDRAPCQAASDPSPSSNGPRMVLAITRHSARSEEHTSELQSLMRISYAVFCLKKKIQLRNENAQV